MLISMMMMIMIIIIVEWKNWNRKRNGVFARIIGESDWGKGEEQRNLIVFLEQFNCILWIRNIHKMHIMRLKIMY